VVLDYLAWNSRFKKNTPSDSRAIRRRVFSKSVISRQKRQCCKKKFLSTSTYGL